jgi:hypothetical protein
LPQKAHGTTFEKGRRREKKNSNKSMLFFFKKKMIAEGGKGAWGNLRRQRKKR